MRRLTGALAMGIGAAAGALLARSRQGDDLSGEVALVTGGSRGLGFLIARRLLREGCAVAICARDPVALEGARRRLARETGGDVMAIECDVADADAVARTVQRIIDRHGRLDILVNNAGIIQVAALETLELEDFRDAMAVAYFGTVHTTLAALPHMRERCRGRIANITSIGGKVAVPHLLAYDGAKFAAVGFSEGLRSELSGTGIAVTTIVPGLMRTGSPVHVEYRGQPEKEYAWFALGDLVPLSAMSAERAARRIVLAIRRGEAEVTMSWQAKLLRALHDLSPGGMARTLGVVNRMLPGPARDGVGDGAAETARGTQLRGTLPGPVESALDRAAARSNQWNRSVEPADAASGTERDG